VVEIVQTVRSLGHSPLFQVLFAWQNAEEGRLELPGLSIEPLKSDSYGVAKFDMSLSLRQVGECIAGMVEYATSLYEPGTVERYLGYYRRLLEGMVAGDESQVMDAVPMLGEAERQQLVYEWSRMEEELPAELYQREWLGEGLAEKGSRRVYIMDGEMEPVPVGVVGEIWIGGYERQGEGMGEGFVCDRYISDRYIEDARAAGAWMYRTGALGRWKADGRIEFAGWKELQVRVRGRRVDLGRIEEGLKEFAGVKEAVVAAREEAGGEKRLVAYYTVAPDVENGEAEESSVRAEELRRYLAGTLPEYMVPAAYVRLEKLPLTAAGKPDRMALPVPQEDTIAARGYEAPEGEIENAIAGIWAEVLKVERVGRQDNFFELGGRSLLAVQMIARLRGVLGLEVAITDVFERPVLASLAECIIDQQLESFDSNDLANILKHIEKP
jgi:hypothetical protein